MVSKLTDIKVAELEQYESLGLFENDRSLHCADFDGGLPGNG